VVTRAELQCPTTRNHEAAEAIVDAHLRRWTKVGCGHWQRPWRRGNRGVRVSQRRRRCAQPATWSRGAALAQRIHRADPESRRYRAQQWLQLQRRRPEPEFPNSLGLDDVWVGDWSLQTVRRV